MPDSEIAIEALLDADRLLKPIPGASPAGTPVRNTPDYDSLKRDMRAQDTAPRGATNQGQQGTDYRAIIARASDLLITSSKDLNVAVWLTEALVQVHGLPGLSEGVLLITRLLETFWDGIHPTVEEDGDEAFRAAPLKRLNTAFTRPLLSTPISSDGRTLRDYMASEDVPLPTGIASPAEFAVAIAETSLQFYVGVEEDIRSARDAVDALQKACNARFKTTEGLTYQVLLQELDKTRLRVQMVARTKPAAELSPVPPPAINEPPKAPPVLNVVEKPQQPPIPVTPPAKDPEPQGVMEQAAALRRVDPTNPVPYMLLRSWSFGPMLARLGAVDEEMLAAPSTELRTSLRRAWLNGDWTDVLEHTETAMETSCGCCWIDLQQYSTRACRELQYEGAAKAIEGMTAAYLKALPDLMYAVMPDGSATASADTLAWIRAEVLVDPQQARTASLNEVRPVEQNISAAESEPDAFEVAENELKAGRFNEAFRVLTQAFAREQAGRARIQRKIQLAKICVVAGKTELAMPLLQEICRVIDDRSLDSWEATDFITAPMAMLYRCFEGVDGSGEQRERIYNKLCAVDPLKALELTAGS